MIVENLLAQIDKGREGKNWGLSTGMPKLEQYTDGLCQETYTVLFSGSGTGKTNMCLSSYVYNPIQSNIDNLNKLEIVYFTLEMKPEILMAKLLSTYMFETFGVAISYRELISKTRDTVLSDEEYEYVRKSIPWMKKVESVLTICDKQLNATSFFKILKDLADKNGTFSAVDNRTIYTPNDPDKVFLVIIDHLGLATPVVGHTLKQEMDEISKIAVQFRNKCMFSFLMIMQANRDSTSTDRRKMELSEPQRRDLKDFKQI